MTELSSNRPWWEGACGYQIYIRSFADSNDDGVGDLNGIRNHLGYLADLGVDFIWITPFYPSPMVDWGYDVADYCDVDPQFGTLGDFDALLNDAHQMGMRVLVDLVPNHSSDLHPWFRNALTGVDSNYRDYYIWADPDSDGGPPNNWIAYFGGSAWTFDKASGQYYMHLFLPQQPDFNWRNSLLVSEFDQILRFWLDRGVDGFRVDVAGALIKDRYLRSNPQIGPWDLNAGRFEQWLAFEHIYDVFQPESHDIFRRWRKIVDEYDAYLFGETYTFDPLELARLLPGDGMHGGFWFEPMHIEWSAQEIHRALSAPIDLLKDRLLWAAGSHDMPRSPTRFGGGDLGRERSFALNILLAFLPGVLVLYQGEELGLVDGRVPLEAALDPVDSGRDGCRTPMPWSVGKGNGFTTGNAWLRSDSRSDYETAQVQLTDPDSWHACYKALLTVRKSLPSLEGFSVVWTELEDSSVISYERGPVGVAINTSTDPNCINVPPDVEIVYSTLGTVKDHATRVTLGSHGGVIWLKASGKSNSI